MQALIDFIIKNLLQLWPLARVYSWQQGLLVRKGEILRELEPGLHWRWLFIDEVFKVNTRAKPINLAAGSPTTTDGHSVTVSANISYVITSIRKLWENAHFAEYEGLIANDALGFLVAACSGYTWVDLLVNRAEIEEELVEYMTEQFETMGVEIVSVRITDFVRARQYRFYSDQALAA